MSAVAVTTPPGGGGGGVMTSSTNSSAGSSGDLVYGGAGEGEGRVMSERVQNLAGAIYKEFEKTIQKYEEDAVKELMPLVVNVLEQLDIAYLEKEEHEVEVELLREDNEQLVTQYEREKQLRRAAEQNNLELQDHYEGTSKEQSSKVESLESIVRMLELKSKNSSDHANRLEERESELKTEYAKLHERYTELFKTHMDYMERTKWIVGADKYDSVVNATSPVAASTPQLLKTRMGVAGLSERVAGVRQVSDILKDTSADVSSAAGTRQQRREASLCDELQEWSDDMSAPGGASIVDSDQEGPNKGRVPIRRDTEASGPETELPETSESGMESADTLGADLTVSTAVSTENGTKKKSSSNLESNNRKHSSSSDSEFAEYREAIRGMGKEVENLIKENTELLETKNALNVVKNDLIAKVDELSSEQEILVQEVRSLEMVRSKMRERIEELEEDLRKTKEDLETLRKQKDDDEDVPMAQRKRFTRLEMARVLTERNQYKERLCELEDTLRWKAMVRASQNETNGSKRKRGLWDFFGGLFGDKESVPMPKDPSSDTAATSGAVVRYSSLGSRGKLLPTSDPILRKKMAGDKIRALDFLDAEYLSEKRQAQRKEQYKHVRAHVKKDESGRLQVYGWSIPAMESTQQPSVAVPVYCRPLTEKDTSLKIWCAAGVDLTGGRTPDGGYIVGDSVFYDQPPPEQPTPPATSVGKLERELSEKQKEYSEAADADWRLSSLVWICSSAHGRSRVSVIDAQNPADVLDSFLVCDSHLLCIASIPGAKETDYAPDDAVMPSSDPLNAAAAGISTPKKHSANSVETSPAHSVGSESVDDSKLGEISWCPLLSAGDGVFFSSPEVKSGGNSGSSTPTRGAKPISSAKVTSTALAEEALLGTQPVSEAATQSKITEGETAANQTVVASVTNDEEDTLTLKSSLPDHVKDGLSKYAGLKQITTVLPTMFMGAQNGNLYIHSSVSEWRKCLRCLRLPDAVLSIVHYKGRVLVALANGSIVVFKRNKDGEWDTSGYYTVNIGTPQHSVRCMTVVVGTVWTGYRNQIYVIDPLSLKIQHKFSAHPRKESQVRQLVWVGDGVWCSIRLDSTLRLYHAHTFQHMQDVDIEPYVSKMLGTSRLGFSFVRITSLLVSCQRLWIGTGNGVIISVPLSETNQNSATSKKDGILTSANANSSIKAPGGVVRVYADPSGTETVAPGTFLPYCSLVQAQLSFHGHKDAVKFFVAIPGGKRRSVVSDPKGLALLVSDSAKESSAQNSSASTSDAASKEESPKRMMVISGGDGYIDFRIGDEEEEGGTTSAAATPSPQQLSKRDLSHLIVWEVQ